MMSVRDEMYNLRHVTYWNLALGRIGFILRQRDPVMPDECLVVEDTPAGIEAAHRANMKVLALCHTAPASDLVAAY